MDPRATRRSARLAEQRPSFPLSYSHSSTQQTSYSSAPSSAFQSSSSLSSMTSLNTNLRSSGMDQDQRYNSAPLPSPSQSSQSQYFGSLSGSQHQSFSGQQQMSQNAYMGQRGGAGGAPETAPFLSNLNLVAEAAKRAQMACLMRDFDDCEL